LIFLDADVGCSRQTTNSTNPSINSVSREMQLVALCYQLSIYINNVRAEERFSDLSDIGDLAKSLVDTNNHVCFPLIYQLLKRVLILPVSEKMLLSNEHCQKCVLE
jgi:hypothetical protein